MYENGKRIPDLKTLCKIADFFGVSLDYLTGHTDRFNPESLLNSRFTDDTTLLQLLDLTEKLTPRSRKMLLRYLRLLPYTQFPECRQSELPR